MLPRFRLVDLSHPFSIHTPGWAGYPPVKHYYIQRFSANEIIAQYIETPLHVSTHLDGQMHAIPGGADIASFPLSRCFGEAVIANAVADALLPLGVRIRDLPLTPRRLHALIEAARKNER